VRGLFSHPSRYRVLPESPIRADSKGWNLTLLDHPVKRRWVNLEQVANIFYRQDFPIVGHDAPFFSEIVGKGISADARDSRAERVRLHPWA
jgi:hypothetical protein